MKSWLISILLYRNFIYSSVKRDLVAMFARSKLGGLWIVINPLAQVLIYALILSNILSAKLPGIDNKYAYAIYLMAGFLAWNLFSDLINRGTNMFVSNAGILQKMSFPKITLPCISVGSSVVNNFLLFATMIVIFLVLGHGFTLQVLWLIPLTALVALLGVSIGLIVGVLNVFMRDIGNFMAIILQVWMWFTPIVYPESIIPEEYRGLLMMNPMYPIVDAYHNVLLYGTAPSLDVLLYIGVLSLFLLGFGLFLFKKANAEMVDVL